jgi:phospholipid transport system substrate-binding protein
MKKLFLIPLFAAFVAFSGGAFAQAIDSSTPDGLVKAVTDQVLGIIKSDPSIKAGDINRITEVVNDKILPYTDFNRTTRLVMGRHWREATPEQQKQIVEQFKMLLIRTYSGALSQVGNQQIEYDKRVQMSEDGKDAVLRSKVVDDNGRQIELDYRLEKTPQGWRVYDLNVAGAWLVVAYQQQFDELVKSGGVAGLLTYLTQKNQQLAQSKQAS